MSPTGDTRRRSKPCPEDTIWGIFAVEATDLAPRGHKLGRWRIKPFDYGDSLLSACGYKVSLNILEPAAGPARRLVRACSMRQRNHGSFSSQLSSRPSSEKTPISNPAGFPLQVVTISLPSASREIGRVVLDPDSGPHLRIG